MAFWQSVVRIQTDKVNPWIALRNALGLALPLGIGAAVGQVQAGLAVSTGALNVSFRDSTAPYVQRARLMFTASVIAGVAVFAGGVTGPHDVTAVVVAGVWALGTGMLVAIGPAEADLGVMSLVMLLVYASSQRASEHAVYAGLLAFAGGLLQTALSLVFWPLRRYVPERRALAALYFALSRAAATPIQRSQAPPATAQSNAAQDALAALDDSIDGARYRSLLTQAERVRLSLLTLARFRVRMAEENSAVGRYLEACGRVLESVGTSLLDERAIPDSGDLEELQRLTEEARGTQAPFSQMDALAGQLRAAGELADHSTTTGAADFEKREAAKPWRLRLAGSLATMRANTTLDSTAFRHALRLAACVAIGDAVARASSLGRAYWLPMTVVIVLKPDFAATFSRGVLRLAGTFAGLIFATALFHVLPVSLAAQVAAIAVLMFILRSFGSANYGLLVTALTALVVLLVAMSGVSPKEVIAERAWSTLGGGAIALLAYWLWPTWERTQFSEALARTLDAYRSYFHAIRRPAVNIDRARMAGRLARVNLEASIERMRDEPGTSKDKVSQSNGILASSVRLAYALMALEAGLYSGHPVLSHAAYSPFANQVELTLHSLAAALRGSPLRAEELPDLREAHHALMHDSETDRITNSLNTLSEGVLRWIGQEPAR